jgi:ATP-dependent Clp protease ATP-binding subunit ClpA
MCRGIEPTWNKNFDVYAKTARIINLNGNIGDIYLLSSADGDYCYYGLNEWLYRKLASDSERVLYYSPTKGLCSRGMLESPDEVSDEVKEFLRQGKGNAKDLTSLAALVSSVCRSEERTGSFALVFPDASRLVVNGKSLSEAEHRAFAALIEAVRESRRPDRLIFLAENLCDLPEFLTQESADIRNIHITLPEQVQRKQYLAKLFPEFTAKEQDKLADASDGLNIREIQRTTVLLSGSPSYKDVEDAFEQYKYGYKDNPWMDMDRDKAMGLEKYLSDRVFGQEEAVKKVSQNILMAQTGIANAFHNRKSRRPVGVCLMVGPTGTGKTLIAKKTAEYVFGSEDAMIRFDMAEYMAPHSAERLKGAPPGYVGYSEGGQLTNAVKAKPHAIILFDEIEKAHPDVLTLLLGVLEDGVLTSGKGETVSFANTFLIFTSNLGAAESASASTNEEAKEIILEAIHRHFYETIGRPEILGRFNRDNAVTVFNRLGPEVTENIVISELKQAGENLKVQANRELVWSADVVRTICGHAAEDTASNGRGVLAALKRYFEAPLAMKIAEEGIDKNVRIHVESITEEAGEPALSCRVEVLSPTDHRGETRREGSVSRMNRRRSMAPLPRAN